jgi:hypothetical protein
LNALRNMASSTMVGDFSLVGEALAHGRISLVVAMGSTGFHRGH